MMIRKLSKEDVAMYLEKALNSDMVLEIVASFESKSILEYRFSELGVFLSTYITSTGDLSEDSMYRIIEDFKNHYHEITNEDTRFGNLTSKEKYYQKYIFPIVISFYRDKLDLSDNLSLKDYLSIYKNMVLTSKNNFFYTHSFSGALLGSILENGLDISKELFTKELAFLNASFGLNSPYQISNLYLTELSAHSFMYALSSPERVKFTLRRRTNLREEENETVHEFHKRIISQYEDILDDNPNKEYLIQMMNEINDFYFLNSDSCIAITENAHPLNSDNIRIPSLFTYALGNKFEYQKLLDEDEKFRIMYEQTKIELENNSNKAISMLQELVNYLEIYHKDRKETKRLFEKINYCLIDGITSYALNCFDIANGEGRIVDGGKISCDKFSIVKFPNPFYMYTMLKKENFKNTKRR